MKTISLLSSAAILVLLTAGAVPAEQPAAEPSSTTASYGAWTLRCVRAEAGAKPQCEVQQTVQAQGQTAPVARVGIGRLPGQPGLVLTALLPVNVTLPGAVHLSGNGKTGKDEVGGLDLSWVRCIGGACIATAPLDAKLVATLRATTDNGAIRFIDAAGKTVSVPMSWSGFDAALSNLPAE